MAYADFRNTQVNISKFNNKYDVTPKPQATAWEALVESLDKRDIRSRKDGRAFSGAQYKREAARSNEGVAQVNLLVLDLDNLSRTAADQAIAKAKELNWICVIYSTHQHTAESPRLRFVGLPSRPIKPEEWPKAWSTMSYLLNVHADENACSESTMYYEPSCTEANKDDAFSLVIEGEQPIDVDKLLEIEIDPVFLKAKSQGKKKGSAAPATNARQIAEDILHRCFSQQLWYFHEQFREYHQGYWRQLDVKIEVMKLILNEHPLLGAKEVSEVTETLKLLTVGHIEESAPDGVRRGRRAPQLICLNNGTLDPVTGELQPHSPSHRLLSALRLAWSPEAKAPLFLQFLKDIWDHEPDFEQRVSFLQEFMGYTLLPSCKFERFLWLIGKGANGKSVLLQIMAALVGEENTSRLHLDRFGSAHVRASLEGKMLNVSSEMTAGATLADGYLKSITSGEPMEAEPKYRDSYSFHPTVKLVAATNTLPHLKDTSGGFARRAVIMSFTRVFEVHERDVNLVDKLLTELPGILTWAVQGLQRLLQRGGFVPPPSSEEVLANYRTESDSVAMFNHECLVPCKTGTAVGELYATYREFCQTNGFQPTNAAVFGRRLTDLGIASLGKKQSGKPYRAARLRKAGDDDAAETVEDDGKRIDIDPSSAPRGRKMTLEEAFADD